MKILAFESTCDETAVAVVEDGRHILTDQIFSQAQLHAVYGGVVPEIASRCHVESISLLAQRAIEAAGITRKDVDAVAVSYAPGLIGAVLVGVNFAKGAAYASGRAADPGAPHPGPYRGQLPGLPGAGAALPLPGHLRRQHHPGGRAGLYGYEDPGRYPGRRGRGVLRQDRPGPGPALSRRQAHRRALPGRRRQRYVFPLAHVAGNPYDMSFSGLKTAVINLVHNAEQKGEEIDRAALAASFTKAVSDSLVPRTVAAARELGYGKVVVAGGVAANSRIRADFQKAAEKEGFKLYIPPLKLCGDNGAMIGAQGYYEFLAGHTAGSDLNAYATMEL